MTQIKADDAWQYEYSMLTAEERRDPIAAMIPLCRDWDFIAGRNRFMLVYATATLEQVKKRNYDGHEEWYELFKAIIDCYLIAAEIDDWIKTGRLTFVSKFKPVSINRVFRVESSSEAIIEASRSKSTPIHKLLSSCARQTLFDFRGNIWHAFTELMMSNYTAGDSAEVRRNWIFLFKNSIRLWELCYRLRELIMTQAIDCVITNQ